MKPKPSRAAPTTALAAAMLATMAGIATPTPAMSQEFFIGQIILGGWNFCPRGSAPADGQLLAISQNQALFSLLGTNFGGNGTTTFGLPDLRGRAAVATGQGLGLPSVAIGQTGGRASVTLTNAQMPAHRHLVIAAPSDDVQVSSGSPTAATAAGSTLPGAASGIGSATGQPTTTTPPGPGTVESTTETTVAGGSEPFDNYSPYLGLTYCIMLQGIFPSQN
jgi:microcystin-dependent protein